MTISKVGFTRRLVWERAGSCHVVPNGDTLPPWRGGEMAEQAAQEEGGEAVGTPECSATVAGRGGKAPRSADPGGIDCPALVAAGITDRVGRFRYAAVRSR